VIERISEVGFRNLRIPMKTATDFDGKRPPVSICETCVAVSQLDRRTACTRVPATERVRVVPAQTLRSIQFSSYDSPNQILGFCPYLHPGANRFSTPRFCPFSCLK
jgi:hypothetical protein